jgi:mannosyltransferase OCH1-like enzyme
MQTMDPADPGEQYRKSKEAETKAAFIKIDMDAVFPPGSDPSSTVSFRLGPPKLSIPKTLHYIWVPTGPDDAPSDFDRACRAQAEAMHPSYGVLTHCDDSMLRADGLAPLRPLLLAAWHKFAGDHRARSDLLKIAAACLYGGISLDWDVWPIRPFDAFLTSDDGLILACNSFDPFVVGEHVIGSTPMNPRLLAVLKFFCQVPKTPREGKYSPQLARFVYHHGWECQMPDVFQPHQRFARGDELYRINPSVTHAVHCLAPVPYDIDRIKALSEQVVAVG